MKIYIIKAVAEDGEEWLSANYDPETGYMEKVFSNKAVAEDHITWLQHSYVDVYYTLHEFEL